MRIPGAAWLVSRWDTMRGSYWFVPGVMAAAAAVTAQGLIAFDRHAPENWTASLPFFYEPSAEGARAVLAAVAGSMITVTGVVFSITIVALTLASSQFGPRLLRNFLHDRGNQVVLGTFVSTFLFSLLVLRAVAAGEGPNPFVPHLATAVAVGLAVTSLFVLIYFIHHAASSIQASSVIASVHREIDEILPSVFPESVGDEVPADDPADPAAERRLREAGTCVPARQSGYVRVIEGGALLRLATAREVVVLVARRPGQFVAAGAPLAFVGEGADPADDDLIAGIAACFVVGQHRTPVQDLGFLTGQLSEMAVRALSPGVNDPRTAVGCVNRLGAVLARLAERHDPSRRRVDEDGRLRVIAQPTTFDDVMAASFDPIRRYGSSDPDVVVAMLEALGEVARRLDDGPRRARTLEMARDVHQSASEVLRSKRDRTQVDAALAAIVVPR